MQERPPGRESTANPHVGAVSRPRTGGSRNRCREPPCTSYRQFISIFMQLSLVQEALFIGNATEIHAGRPVHDRGWKALASKCGKDAAKVPTLPDWTLMHWKG